MFDSLTEAILNADKPIPDANGIYMPWEERYSLTISDFYSDFIEKRLPDIATVIRWHDMLVRYSQRKDAIFPIRAGNTSKRLRRGWLVRVDDGFSYMFTDNDLAAYIYKMALDGYCPEEQEFYEFMTRFVEPNQIEWLTKLNENPKRKTLAMINNLTSQDGNKARRFLRMPVHFNQIGGPGVDVSEDEKNAYINTTPAPVCCLGKYNYKHAHLIGVADTCYKIANKKFDFKDVKTYLLGDDADYKWDSSVDNYVWNRKVSDYVGEIPFNTIEFIIKAQFFRFLDPINHFLAPMTGRNKFTKKDGTYSLDIAEYINLQKYIVGQKQSIYKQIIPASGKTYFDDYKEKVCASEEMFNIDVDISEKIDIVYHEKSLGQEIYKNPTKASGMGKRSAVNTNGSSTSKASKPIKIRKKAGYEFEGETKIRRVILAVVNKFINDNPNINYHDLKSIFNIKLCSKPLIRLDSELSRGDIIHSNVFPERIPLVDGNIIAINNQAQGKDMPRIVQIAKALGYTITEL